jgi:hypothetical protein
VGHKPDQRARKKRREREAKKQAEADFRKKLSAVSKAARSLYEACLREIDLAKGRGETSAGVAVAWPDDDTEAAAELLRHPRNGFNAYGKPADESPGGHDVGKKPRLIISW